MDVLLTGRGLLESIRWHGGVLYVSDWSAGEVLTVPGGVVAEVASGRCTWSGRARSPATWRSPTAWPSPATR